MKKAKKLHPWFKDYHACWQCGKKASWHYSPNDGDPDRSYECDDCVTRGCSCNTDYDTGLPQLDSKGRELPCCEYWSLPNGFPLVFQMRSSLSSRPAALRNKWLYDQDTVDRRRQRGQLRKWIKAPKDWWRPSYIQRLRNDPVRARLLKLAYPLILEWDRVHAESTTQHQQIEVNQNDGE